MLRNKKVGELEALLFASGEPISVADIAAVLEVSNPVVWELISELGERYKADEFGIELREVAGGFQLCTKEIYQETMQKLIKTQELRITNAAMETLAIIAFKQPVTRGEMEAIRGVKVDGVVNTLLDYGLITEVGRKDTIGKPILYGTTEVFLQTFGINSLKDLPEFPEGLLEEEDEIEQISLLTEEIYNENE